MEEKTDQEHRQEIDQAWAEMKKEYFEKRRCDANQAKNEAYQI